MTENYDYYRRKKAEDDDYLRNLLETKIDDSELFNILAYRGQLYYDSLKRIRKLRKKLGQTVYDYSAST